MGILNSLLGAATWPELIEELEEQNVTWISGWVGDLLNILSQIMWVALAIVGAAGSIYAIYIGVKMARADSAEAREENKKRMINIIVTIIVVVVLIVVFNTAVPAIVGAIVGKPGSDGTITQPDPSKKQSIDAIVNMAKVLLRVA